MSNQILGRYSKYIRTIVICYDFLVLVLAQLFMLKNIVSVYFIIATLVFWGGAAFFTRFYAVYRFTSLYSLSLKLLKQSLFFLVSFFCLAGLFYNQVSNFSLLWFIAVSLLFIVGFKFFTFFSLRYFREYFNGNNRKVITIGADKQTEKLIQFFNTKKYYGYNLKKSLKSFDIEFLENWIKTNKIDEIYLSLENLSVNDLKEMILFADNHFINLKYIPGEKEIIIKSKEIQYYENIPIISEYKTPLHDSFNRFVKRLFDLFFSTLVIVFIMSWLYPIIAILIKLDSPGSVIFKQKRNGLYYKEFDCYKFRSMYVNNKAHVLQAEKGDKRITKIGKFLRKTSLDEMPQFFNVFIGNMSVCGPRPHMLVLSEKYEKQVFRYKLRHFVKPGITGMAQTHGYRGEIKTKENIINRVKYDVFYIEKWSLYLDIKIIFLTIKNIIIGDEKAY